MESMGSIGILMLLLCVAVITFSIVVHRAVCASVGRERRLRRPSAVVDPSNAYPLLLPGCWLVVKGSDVLMVQSTLRLHEARFCTWVEGLTNAEGLFIAPPIKGWIVIVGSRLPSPWKDVDACFRFVLDLSRKLGKIQLFSADRATLRHAWVKAEAGRVVRAYAWDEQTIWAQGLPTKAETELHLTCFDYLEPLQESQTPAIEANLAKIPLLAAKWGLDPAHVRSHLLLKELGVMGEPAQRY